MFEIFKGGIRKFNRTKPTITPNELIQRIARRAERLDNAQQISTFVSLGGIEQRLLNADNRIIYGRRGTGKTHILSYVSNTATQRNDFAVNIDIRTIGSNSYLYSDQSRSIGDRATLLLRARPKSC